MTAVVSLRRTDVSFRDLFSVLWLFMWPCRKVCLCISVSQYYDILIDFFLLQTGVTLRVAQDYRERILTLIRHSIRLYLMFFF